MASPAHSEHKVHWRGRSRFSPVYAAMLLLSLHWSVVTYVNSTFLEQFTSTEGVGTLYVMGSAITIVAFLFITQILGRLGNYQLTLGLAIAEIIALVVLFVTPYKNVVIPVFVLHHAIVPLLLFNLDVFMEGIIGKRENGTGGKRGLLLTIMSIAGAVAPLLSGFLIGSGSPRFYLVYIASALFMLPFLYVIIKHFKSFEDPTYHHINVFASLRHFWKHKNLRFVFCAHFLLQLFFAWMVIYTPLYLASTIGFTWDQIGLIIFFGLLAYVILEYPIGEIADRYLGEKEMMATGFLIMSLATIWLGCITTAALVPWMVTMFLSRVGASLVETTSESYFFKHIKGSDADIIGFFRITRPLAYLIGALFASATLLSVSFGGLFIVLGLVMLLGIPAALMLEDTR
jgi:MFS family permease